MGLGQRRGQRCKSLKRSITVVTLRPARRRRVGGGGRGGRGGRAGRSFRQHTVIVGLWKGRRDGEPLDGAALHAAFRDWAVQARARITYDALLRAWVLRGWLQQGAGPGMGYRLSASLWAIAGGIYNSRAATAY
jgi:hypothetical protein